MISEVKTIHRCEYCRKIYLVKSAAEKHEKYCWKNPANHYACFDCIFLVKDRETLDGGMSDGISVRTFHCSKLDKPMHTMIAVIRKLDCVKNTELMPLNCEHRKDYIDDYFDNQE